MTTTRLDKVWQDLENEFGRVVESWNFEGSQEIFDQFSDDKKARLQDYLYSGTTILESASEFQWFDLGELSKEQIQEILEDYEKGQGIVDPNLSIPFDKTVFSVKINDFRVAFTDNTGENDEESHITHSSEYIEIYLICFKEEDSIIVYGMPYMKEHRRANLPARCLVLSKEKREDGLYVWSKSIGSVSNFTVDSKNPVDMLDFRYVEMVMPVFDYALNLLACDNVYVDREEAPEKLNKKKQKKGERFLIPARNTIRVSVEGCEVFNYSEGSRSHASPVIHLRRGHIRRLATGKTTWVKPCVVGKKGKIVNKVYEVR